jgi:formyltetrahydrofolate deformylase
MSPATAAQQPDEVLDRPSHRAGLAPWHLQVITDDKPSRETLCSAAAASGTHPATVFPTTRLLISCPARPGVARALALFLANEAVDVLGIDQRASSDGRMFIRAELHCAPGVPQRMLERRFLDSMARPLSMDYRIAEAGRRKRIAVLVSRYDHCLVDLLWRARRGELDADIGLVASNHADLKPLASGFGVPWQHVPVDKDSKSESERRLLETLAGRFDLVVLARYMQILSGDFLRSLGCPVINVHHSLLPAFVGAGTYERAIKRGVKLIGATAHYVTAELDAGPIIEQDAIRISDRDHLEAVTRVGADLERLVLARAVAWHCEDRIVVHNNTTVIF